MNEIRKEYARMRAQNYCCSQIIIELALEAIGEENNMLISAMRGLCGGLHTGGICGTLPAGACLLAMLAPEKAESEMIPRLVEWFNATFAEAYSGIECNVILGGDPMNRIERCPEIICQTYFKCRELLAENGIMI